MKILICKLLTICCLALFPLSLFSQWYSVYSNPGFSITKVFVQNRDTVYAVGDSGVLLKTNDGGLTWGQILLPTTCRLFSITFPTTSAGYICGENGTLLKTIDGGSSWQQCITNTNLHLRCLTFFNDTIGWIGGSSSKSLTSFSSDSGIILKTSNGGISFLTQKLLNQPVLDIKRFNSDTCIAIAFDSTLALNHILRTANGGNLWQDVYTLTTEHPLKSIAINSGTSYAGSGYAFLLKSVDYGSSWNLMFVSGLTYVNELSFPSVDTGYAAGSEFELSGAIQRSGNSGNNWTIQKQGLFLSISFANNILGYASTINGEIFKTTNGGVVGISPSSELNQLISIYPSVFKSELSIHIDKKLWIQIGESFSVEILSISGVRLKQIYGNAPIIYISDLSGLSNGIYYISLAYGGRRIFIRKVIKY